MTTQTEKLVLVLPSTTFKTEIAYIDKSKQLHVKQISSTVTSHC